LGRSLSLKAPSQLSGLQNYIAGIVVVSAISADDTERAQSEIASLLRDRHHLRAGDEDDFNIRNLTEMANAQQQGTQTLTALLAAIAVVSLVVGGIGIMNIMLVSVTERTREIGIRKALGAKRQDVMLQFLIESAAMSLLGGLFGVIGGVTVAEIVTHLVGFPSAIALWSVVLGLLVATSVGIFFGVYPAHKAAQLDPIVALRAEL
jgi:putative ABC transport system permease protein